MQPSSLDKSQSIDGSNLSGELALKELTNGNCNLEDVVLSKEEDLIPQVSAQLNLEGRTKESKHPFKEEDTAADILCFEVGKEVRSML